VPKYSWRCPNACAFEAWAPFSYEPDEAEPPCPEHGLIGRRDLPADLATVRSICDDDIRRAYLGSEIDRNLAEQGRPLDPLAPRDRFEARHIEKALGRIHIGNDYSMLRPISQRAIERGPVRKPRKIVLP